MVRLSSIPSSLGVSGDEKIAKDNKAIEDSLKDAQSRVRARLMKELGPKAEPQKPAAARPAIKE